MLLLAIGLCIKAGGFSFDHGIAQDVLLAKTKEAGIPGEPGSFWALMAVVTRVVGEENLQWAGKGLRDTTRLSASPADMWRSILATNSAELRPLLKYYASELIAIADKLEDPDAVTQLFDEAARAKRSCP